MSRVLISLTCSVVLSVIAGSMLQDGDTFGAIMWGGCIGLGCSLIERWTRP